MTAQLPETLHIDGEILAMFSNPLAAYFSLSGKEPPFDTLISTALWRGYMGFWEIRADRLYLIGLEGFLEGGRKGTLGDLFPNNHERVFAHWYSGVLRMPQGEMLNYVHQGYASIYEQDLLIEVENGVVKKRTTRYNTFVKSEPR